MKPKKRYLLLLAGVTSSIFGIFMAIPALLKENYLAGSIFVTLLVFGLVLIALAFGEEDEQRI